MGKKTNKMRIKIDITKLRNELHFDVQNLRVPKFSAIALNTAAKESTVIKMIISENNCGIGHQKGV